MHRKILLSWSSGKDSAWTLHRLRQAGDNEVVAFLTTVNEAFDRVAMHGVRRELLEAQAKAAGVELWPVGIPYPCSNELYEEVMSEALIAPGVPESTLSLSTTSIWRTSAATAK